MIDKDINPMNDRNVVEYLLLKNGLESLEPRISKDGEHGKDELQPS